MYVIEIRFEYCKVKLFCYLWVKSVPSLEILHLIMRYFVGHHNPNTYLNYSFLMGNGTTRMSLHTFQICYHNSHNSKNYQDDFPILDNNLKLKTIDLRRIFGIIRC